MALTRKQILDALAALFDPNVNNSSPFAIVRRKLRIWTNVPKEMRPALYVVKTHERGVTQGPPLPPKTTLIVKLFIYTWVREQDVPSDLLDPLLDFVDTQSKPDFAGQRMTLGGLVHHVWRDGETLFVAGDLEGDGIAVVPVSILVPSFV